jgi:5-methylcytosine-specific restriction endonuclease McrA
MSKRKFTASERHAIFTVHGEKCYLNGCPLDLKTMEVDHVIPEALLNAPEKLDEVLRAFGLPPGFDLNCYANWMPACRPCNGKKLAMVFKPTPLIQLFLQTAAEKATEAAAMAAKTVADREINEALNVLERANEAGQLEDDVKSALRPLVTFQRAVRASDIAEEPIRLTPYYEVLIDDGLVKIVRGRSGVGGRPSNLRSPADFDCPS